MTGAVKVAITSSVDILAQRGILPRNSPAPDMLWRQSEKKNNKKLTLKLRYGNENTETETKVRKLRYGNENGSEK